MKKSTLIIAFALVLSAAAGYYTPSARADGGPLPMCPPCKPGGGKNCGPNCTCSPTHNCLHWLQQHLDLK